VVVDAEKTGKSKMITVKLVGKSYLVRVPKTAWALKLAVRARQAEQAPDLMATAMDEWIARVFSAEDAATVMRRLYDDPDDELDIDHIMALMEKMLDRAGSPNPTS
jgi:hypothetical protein